jgi:hypothetical protein
MVPSFWGDISLTQSRGGAAACVLVAERVSIGEREALTELDRLARKKGWLRESDPSLVSPCKADLAAPLEKVARLLARLMKPGRRLVTAVRFRDGRIEELLESHYEDAQPITALEKRPESEGVEKEKKKKEEEEEEEEVEAVTVAAPRNGCPPPDLPDYEIRATRVLNKFLSTDQQEDFRRHQRFLSVGALTGHRYLVSSRFSRGNIAAFKGQLYDLDEQRTICIHVDDSVPAPEELLAIHACLSIPRWESHLTGAGRLLPILYGEV